MKKALILVICAAAVLFIIAIYNGYRSTNSANAFEWEKQVYVYLGNSEMGSSEDCSKVFPVARTILNAETFGPGALDALLKGVTEKEKEDGYFTSINDGVFMQKFEIMDGVAYIDFSSKFNEGMGGSCKVTNIRAQIENTLTSLPDINSVVISVNGKTEGILEP